jgi:ADP-heptose:LPS heptosyltransferase
MPTFLFHTGALGDFITILPAIAIWKNQHPGDSLTLFGKPEIGPLARDIGLVDESVDVTAARFAPLFNSGFSPEVRKILAPYSSAIIFSSSSSLLAQYCRTLGIEVYEQEAFSRDRTHVIDYHLSLFINPATLDARHRMPRIALPKSALEATFRIISPGEKFLVIHPGSGSARKNWPMDRFLLLADHLRRQGKTIVWIKGPAESDLGRLPGTDCIVENPQLSALAAILKRAEFFLGNDSGVAHLAAAAGCPSLVLFGASDPNVWSPRGHDVRIVFSKEISCAPCHLNDRVLPASCDGKCMASITADEVISLLAESFPL